MLFDINSPTDQQSKFAYLMKLMKEGKKIWIGDYCCSDGTYSPLRYGESVCNKDGSQSYNITNIEYLYTNPQRNIMYAQLEDGREIRFDLPVLKLTWINCIKEYIPPVPPVKEMTIADIEKIVGSKVKIIGEDGKSIG